ncbi:DUF262 domain-containing protein [Cellulomonas oligotrophica]|uniref:GmrSD restriction endonucleases N-terminal domain-containing protein n=1 Tax=Cellulomonas oligotrophica TaxID=931536 RepID=A0A7Y9JYQ3_9CELL|nr:DUF262 domain-containing protein [Cellulomonas oligotrophica]NYD88008.1 hypothetical protein [Cellulomonas oligotrophica]GIG34502.1 hypothetical protein Col01nite_36610 [Cellulomonas oligotrophica]
MTQRTTTIDDPDLVELLDGIDAGQVALPNFQRDFDWTDSDVRALLATVLNGWPMGSLLLIEGNAHTRDFYDPRPFEYAPPIAGIPDTIVLDGQQRLTSLYTALYDKSESVHAVALGHGLLWDDIDSLDDSLRTFKRSVWREHYATPAAQIASQLMPISALRSSSRFFDWRDVAAQGDPVLTELLTATYRQHLSGLYRYRMPALRITRDTHPAAVARIFERVNKTGQQLGAFDLMVAKSFTPDFNLRVVWERARQRYPELSVFYGSDGFAPLQVIALRVLDDVRTSTVLRLTPASIHDYWEHAVESLARAVRFAMQHLGVLSREWLPYGSLMIVLGAHLWSDQISESKALAIKRWFWRSSLTARYAVGSNSVAVADFKRLEGGAFEADDAIILDWGIFRDATKQSAGAIHRAWLCALATSSRRRDGDLDASVPTPRSLVPRDVRPGPEVSPHLLTLGFALFTDDQSLRGQFLPGDSVPEFDALADSTRLANFLRERLDEAARFIARDCDQRVRVVDDSDQELLGLGD